ncbi:MAG: glycosyltransferase [Lachnospiraceae bacterium]|nr:glycosyltransferase [Lachnospiraceae bacterium]
MKILMMHQTVTSHDAIGNDIEKMYLYLSQDYNCQVFAQNKFNDRVEYIEEKDLVEELSKPENVVIYHHSVYWEMGEALLAQAKCKVVFKYHNITPAHFFEEYNDFHFEQCKKGREQTKRLIENFPTAIWLNDSIYNSKEIEGVPEERKYIVPPFNKVEEWKTKKPNEQLLDQLLTSDEKNILFVSRVAPNKGHLDLVEILRLCLINYGVKFHLRIIGKFDDGLQKYNSLIFNKIKENQLDGYIEFIGEVNDSDLLSYFLGSDVYLSYSKHEGFCVPVIEAQYLHLPVIALDACAVKETMGSEQVTLDEKLENYAAAIELICTDSSVKNYLIAEGEKNFKNRFTDDIILKQLNEGLREVLV